MKRDWFLLGFMALFVLAVPSWAQTDRATLTGTVTDSSGAVVPGVSVVATNLETKVETSAITNDEGLYRVLNLPVGQYKVSFKKEGFKAVQRAGITLTIRQVAEINVMLEVGAVAQTIEVTAPAPILQAQTSDLGTTMTNRNVVNDLPLDITGGREFETFAYAIVPGVEGNSWTSYIAGTPSFSKEVLIDGTLQQGSESGSVDEDYPPMDAVEEFKVETGGTSGAAAAYSSGGTFLFTMKSGTNQFHGSGLFYLQNEALNANTWMNNYYQAKSEPASCSTPDCSVPRDRQTDYGFSGGGPIRKDKTFFFAAFEQYRTNDYTTGSFNRTVPTPDFLQGDFSALLDKTTQLGADAAGNPIYKGAIFNPGTGDVFPNNVIPPGMFSTVSKKIVDIYQKYYTPMNSALFHNDAATELNNPWFHQTQLSFKVDHNITDKDRLASSFIWTERPRILADSGKGVWDPSNPYGGPLAQSRIQKVTSRSFRFSESHNFTPSTLNVASFTYLRYRNPSEATAASGNWPQQLGFGNTGVGNFPSIDFGSSVNGYAEDPIGYSSSGFYVSNIFVGDDSLTWVRGRHTFTFGGEFRGFEINSHAPSGTLNFSFSPDQTGDPTQKWGNEVGFGFASFLLGDVQRAYQDTSLDLYGRRKGLSLYATDSFKMNSKTTLSLGLSWTQTYPWHEMNGHWGNFSTTEVNPSLGIPGVMVYGKNGGSTFEGPIRWRYFAPTLGLAYQLKPRVVARAAYGIFYTPIGSDIWEGVPYGFAPGFRSLNQVQLAANHAPAFNWDNGYPGKPVPGTLDPNFLQWGMVTVSPDSLVPGRIQQWNGGVEIGLSKDSRLSLNYLGTRGYHLHDGELQNNTFSLPAYSKLIQSGHDWDWVSDPASAAAAGVPYPYQGYSNYAFMTLFQFPQIQSTSGPLYGVNSPLGSSGYDAFQAELVQRNSHGLTADLSFTYARQISNVDSYYGNFAETYLATWLQNLSDLSYAANFVQPYNQAIVKGYVDYDLPFGQGRKFLSNRGGAFNALVGGWRTGVTVYYGTGTPLTVDSNYFYEGISSYYQVATVYSQVAPNANLSSHFNRSTFDPDSKTPSVNEYFNPKVITNPTWGAFGNSGPYIAGLKGFGTASEDLGIYKDFKFGEQRRLQLRGEIFNLFNRHYFDNPITDLGSPNFGSALSVGGAIPPRRAQIGVRFEW